MLRAWLGPLEAWLAQFDDGLLPLARTEVIDADLAGIPGACPQTDLLGWPAGASAAYRWGVRYVIEGSQLGGAVLYQRLAQPLAPHPLRYLRGAPEGPGPRWRAFMLALQGAVTTPGEIADACVGACDAFDRILGLRC